MLACRFARCTSAVKITLSVSNIIHLQPTSRSTTYTQNVNNRLMPSSSTITVFVCCRGGHRLLQSYITENGGLPIGTRAGEYQQPPEYDPGQSRVPRGSLLEHSTYEFGHGETLKYWIVYYLHLPNCNLYTYICYKLSTSILTTNLGIICLIIISGNTTKQAGSFLHRMVPSPKSRGGTIATYFKTKVPRRAAPRLSVWTRKLKN